MSDVTTESTDVQSSSQQEGDNMVMLRLVSNFPLHESITVGGDGNQVTIDRNGTDVPADRVEELTQAAAASGYSVEVVPE